MKEAFQAMQKMKKERHEEWYKCNMEELEKSKIPFKWASDTCILIREKQYPKIDFYPHTGRWRCKNKTYSGGAIKLLLFISAKTLD